MRNIILKPGLEEILPLFYMEDEQGRIAIYPMGIKKNDVGSTPVTDVSRQFPVKSPECVHYLDKRFSLFIYFLGLDRSDRLIGIISQ